MGRRSQLGARFDRQPGLMAHSLCQACLRFSGQIQPAPKILSQRELPPKKLVLLHLIFSYFWSCSARQRFRISRFKTETQLTLCDSVPGYCAGASKKRKQNV